MDLIVKELKAILEACLRANKLFTIYLGSIGIIAGFCYVSAPATKMFWLSYIVLVVLFIVVAKTRRKKVGIFDNVFRLRHIQSKNQRFNSTYTENKGYKVPITPQESLVGKEQIRQKEAVGSNVSQPAQASSIGKHQTIPVPITRREHQTDKDAIRELESALNKEILFQGQAVEAVVKALKREVIGTEFKENKVQAFLMVGSTGTGKTKIAEVTAKILGRYFTRYDMGAYKHDSGVQQLLGTPQGFVGDKGKLTSEIQQHPKSIILFDEIEKGDVRVLDFLLGILDRGTIKDNRSNEEVNFGECKIFLTTNLIKDIDETKTGEWAREALERQGFLRTEFLARVNVIPFVKFTEEQLEVILEVIVEKNVKGYLKKVCEERGYKAKVSGHPTMLSVINRQINREFGARDVERILIKEIGDPLTDSIFNLKSNVVIKEIYLNVSNNKIVPELKF